MFESNKINYLCSKIDKLEKEITGLKNQISCQDDGTHKVACKSNMQYENDGISCFINDFSNPERFKIQKFFNTFNSYSIPVDLILNGDCISYTRVNGGLYGGKICELIKLEYVDKIHMIVDKHNKVSIHIEYETDDKIGCLIIDKDTKFKLFD